MIRLLNGNFVSLIRRINRSPCSKGCPFKTEDCFSFLLLKISRLSISIKRSFIRREAWRDTEAKALFDEQSWTNRTRTLYFSFFWRTSRARKITNRRNVVVAGISLGLLTENDSVHWPSTFSCSRPILVVYCRRHLTEEMFFENGTLTTNVRSDPIEISSIVLRRLIDFPLLWIINDKSVNYKLLH